MNLDLAPLKVLVKEAVREVLREMLAAGELGPAALPASASSNLLTTAEVGARCGGADPETVLGWIHSGKLPASRPGHVYLVDPEDLKRFLAGQRATEKKPIPDDAHFARILERVDKKRGPKK